MEWDQPCPGVPILAPCPDRHAVPHQSRPDRYDRVRMGAYEMAGKQTGGLRALRLSCGSAQ